MLDLFTIFGIVCATLITAAVCFVVIAACIARIYADADAYRRTDANDRAYAEINQAERWLSYEWPIVEDLAEHLRCALNDTAHESISDFRDRMRKKYSEVRA